VSSLLDALQALHAPGGRDEDAPLRLTEGGLWHATPLPVLAGAVPLVVEYGLVPSRQPLVVLDAGAGDGRVLSALALGLPDDVEARLLGLEIDSQLAAAAEAQARLAPVAWGRRPRIAIGDYLAVRDYAALGIAPEEVDLVFNYPDGNERRLLAWLRGHAGTEARLVILSPDHDPAMDAPPLLRTRVEPTDGTGVAWSLSVYAVAAERR
jgi:hypothetical protein